MLKNLDLSTCLIKSPISFQWGPFPNGAKKYAETKFVKEFSMILHYWQAQVYVEICA